MCFKPSKSRSLVLKRGKVVDKFHFTISGTIIPTLSEKPVKSLRKLFDCSLKNSAAIHKTCGDLEAWLTKTYKSGLLGRFKAWIFQHARVLWPLLLYEVPMSTVEALEKISSYL